MTQRIHFPLIARAFELHAWLSERLDGLEVSRQPKSLLAASCHDVVIEHQLAIAVLLDAGINGSAFALVRSLFETFVRGVWLGNCATEDEITQFKHDRVRLGFGEILEVVERVDGFRDGVLTGLKERSWRAMNSYTHGGIQQIGRRLSGAIIEPNYSPEEIAEVIKLAGTFALLAFQQIAISASRMDLATEAVERLASIGNGTPSVAGTESSGGG